MKSNLTLNYNNLENYIEEIFEQCGYKNFNHIKLTSNEREGNFKIQWKHKYKNGSEEWKIVNVPYYEFINYKLFATENYYKLTDTLKELSKL